MSKNSGGGTQTTVSANNLPQWVTNAGMTNLNQSYNVAQNMLGPYTGDRVAGMTPGANGLIAALMGTVGSSAPAYGVAQSALSGLTNFGMPQVNPGSVAQTDLSAYMNPFTSSVINSGMQAIDTMRQQALNSNADQAVSQKAFGGSRQGVQEGVTNAAAAMQAGNLASQLGMQNFQQAQAQANADLDRNFSGQIANQNAAATGAGIGLSAANGLANVAGMGQNSLMQQIMGALQGQQLLQGNTQAQLDANQAAYRENQQFPLQQLMVPLQSLGLTPYGSTTTQTSQLPSGNGLMSGLGAGMAGLGLLGSLFGGGGAFPMVGAGALWK